MILINGICIYTDIEFIGVGREPKINVNKIPNVMAAYEIKKSMHPI